MRPCTNSPPCPWSSPPPSSRPSPQRPTPRSGARPTRAELHCRHHRNWIAGCSRDPCCHQRSLGQTGTVAGASCRGPGPGAKQRHRARRPRTVDRRWTGRTPRNAMRDGVVCVITYSGVTRHASTLRIRGCRSEPAPSQRRNAAGTLSQLTIRGDIAAAMRGVRGSDYRRASPLLAKDRMRIRSSPASIVLAPAERISYDLRLGRGSRGTNTALTRAAVVAPSHARHIAVSKASAWRLEDAPPPLAGRSRREDDSLSEAGPPMDH